MTLETLNLETLMLHAGSHRRDLSTNSVAVPIHQTTSLNSIALNMQGNYLLFKN